MVLSLALILTGCETPAPAPTPAETAVVVATQAATSRSYVTLICAKPVRPVDKIDVTWKGINVVPGSGGWSEPQKLALTMPLDAMLCGNPSATFQPGAATTLMVQLDDMSAANGIWIEFPSPEYRDDETDPNQSLFLPTTDDNGWFTFAVYPVQRGIPLIPIGTVRPGHALAPPIEKPEESIAPPPAPATVPPDNDPFAPPPSPADAAVPGTAAALTAH